MGIENARQLSCFPFMTPRAPFTIPKKISVPDNSLNRTLKLSCGDTIAVEYDCCQCGKLSVCDVRQSQQVGIHSSENNHQINASWRFLMRFVQCSCARLRRVCAPTITGSNRHYSHFRRNLSAPVSLLLRRGSAGCVCGVDICRRNQDATVPARGFNMLNHFLRRFTRRNRAHVVTERSS